MGLVSERLQKEIIKLSRKVNDRLRRLERAGLQEESQEYRTIERYAIKKNSKSYNVNLEKGTIRTTKDFSRFSTASEIYDYKQMLQNILEAQTSTVRGTRASIKRAYNAFMESRTHDLRPQMTYEQYANIFKIYRTQVEPDKKDHFSSDTVLDLIENTDIYTLSDSQIAQAMIYASEYGTDELIDNYFEETDEGLVFIT